MHEANYTAEALIARKRHNWPEASTPVGDLVVRLFRARDMIYEHSRARVKAEFGLTPAEFEVLVTLRTVEPPYRLMPTRLRRSLLITPGGITKVLKSLEARGLIARTRNEKDGRSRSVMLTRSGVRLAEKVLPMALAQYESQINKALSAQDVAQMSDLLRVLLLALEPESGRALSGKEKHRAPGDRAAASRTG